MCIETGRIGRIEVEGVVLRLRALLKRGRDTVFQVGVWPSGGFGSWPCGGKASVEKGNNGRIQDRDLKRCDFRGKGRASARILAVAVIHWRASCSITVGPPDTTFVSTELL